MMTKLRQHNLVTNEKQMSIFIRTIGSCHRYADVEHSKNTTSDTIVTVTVTHTESDTSKKKSMKKENTRTHLIFRDFTFLTSKNHTFNSLIPNSQNRHSTLLWIFLFFSLFLFFCPSSRAFVSHSKLSPQILTL